MLRDSLHRPLRDLRVSVTDRCNYRCSYCMPLEEYAWMERDELLSFEEITRLARAFARLGVVKVRLTGGEPLLRRRLDELVGQLAAIDGLQDICLTTNGSLLVEKAPALAAAGLTRINVSLDTLRPERFRQITRRDDLDSVLAGLAAAEKVGLGPVKINCVIERGVNDDEILDLVDFCRERSFSLRFIEFMDVGNVNEWRLEKTVSAAEIVEVIRRGRAVDGAATPDESGGSRAEGETATLFRFADGGDVGVIASVTRPFCGDCTRARLTADGKLVTCLFSADGHDLKALVRGGASDKELVNAITAVWKARTDRHSEVRLEAIRSSGGYRPDDRRKIEMIRLGG